MLQYESDAWMMVSTDSGRSGLVPSSFLKVLTQSPFNRPSFQVRCQMNSKHTTSMLAVPHIAWRVTIWQYVSSTICSACAGSIHFSGTGSRCICASQLRPLHR